MFTGAYLEKAAYLHDLGRLNLKKEELPTGVSYCQACADFLAPYLSGTDGRVIYQMIADMEQPKDLLSAILHWADRIASGVDVRGKSGHKDVLANLFNRFDLKTSSPETYYPIDIMRQEECPYPAETVSAVNHNAGLEFIQKKLSAINAVDRSTSDIARILEIACSNFPASSSKEGLSDISMYDHAKLTAAAANCLYRFIQESSAADGFLSAAKRQALESENLFLLVSGDISGIQRFIYTIPSKGALKSLRGRSFYLDILLEHIADEILAGSGLTRSNLLYTGGGHFYLLLPNSKKQIDYLQHFAEYINDWLLRYFGSRLYLALAWTPSTPAEFMGITANGSGAPFRRASTELAHQKLCRYTKRQLSALFNTNSAINHNIDGSRECSICHTSAQQLFPYNTEDASWVCAVCRNLYLLGEKMLNRDGFLVSTQQREGAVPLPGDSGDMYLYPVKWKDVGRDGEDVVRIYIKNELYVDHPKAVYLWLADYTARDSERILEFSQLADRSGGSSEESGIRRLGVFRADVDNLGAAFMAGFSGRLATLSRTSTLSRRLALFFKHYINVLCAGELNGSNKAVKEKFRLFQQEKKVKRDIHVVYSGGDDVFLVGAWDDLLELAVDLYEAFKQFTNGKLTFSAGIGLFPAGCPISEMARKTGDLEDVAKANPDGKKDSIALFGASTEVQGSGKTCDEPERFHWQQFIEKVCGEKLGFIKTHFNFSGVSDETARLPIGCSALYRILGLLEAPQNAGTINIARFAYLLARLDPGRNADAGQMQVYKEVRTQFYSWYRSSEDRRELRTAVEIVIYNIRAKKEDV